MDRFYSTDDTTLITVKIPAPGAIRRWCMKERR